MGKLPRVPLREQVFEVLSSAIVAGDIAPGVRLRDTAIAVQLGVSRTPVREAMLRLEAYGLVETKPGSSTTVTHVDLGADMEVIPVVASLHALAARLGVEKLSDEALSDMRSHNRDMEFAAQLGNAGAMIEADRAFHHVLVEAAGNAVLRDLLERLTVTVRRLEWPQFDKLTGEISAHDHDDIVAACEKGDPDLAGALVQQNWMTLCDLIAARQEETESIHPKSSDHVPEAL